MEPFFWNCVESVAGRFGLRWNWFSYGVAGIILVLGFPVLLDQYLQIEVWIQWGDLLHHESFTLDFFALGVGILMGLILPGKDIIP